MDWKGKQSGEWCVAYHDVAQGQSSDNVKKATGSIFKSEKFKPGSRQMHKDCIDKYHYPKKVGEGAYFTPHIKTAEYYSGISNINGKIYKTIFMVRVKPTTIRHCTDSRDFWVVNGTSDEVRPYRILYKQC